MYSRVSLLRHKVLLFLTLCVCVCLSHREKYAAKSKIIVLYSLSSLGVRSMTVGPVWLHEIKYFSGTPQLVFN